MTMLRCDSFDFYNTAQLPRYWTISGATITAAGRNSTSALTFPVRGHFAEWTFPANLAEGFAHFAFTWTRANTDAESVFYQVIDNATIQFVCLLRADRKVDVRLTSATGTLLGTTSQALPAPGILIHCQIHWLIANAGGIVRILFDDVEVLNFSGDTQVTANAFATKMRFGAGAGTDAATNCLIDDFVFNDNAGSVNNGLIGDKRVMWCPALAEGATSDYTPSTGTDNAAMVDENPANDDTDYIQSSTIGHIDYVTISVSPAIPTGSTIDAVAVVTQDKKTDGGTRTARHKIRFGSGPTVSNGAQFAPATTYTIHKTVFEDAITVAEVNAPMQVGSEVVT